MMWMPFSDTGNTDHYIKKKIGVRAYQCTSCQKKGKIILHYDFPLDTLRFW